MNKDDFSLYESDNHRYDDLIQLLLESNLIEIYNDNSAGDDFWYYLNQWEKENDIETIMDELKNDYDLDIPELLHVKDGYINTNEVYTLLAKSIKEIQELWVKDELVINIDALLPEVSHKEFKSFLELINNSELLPGFNTEKESQ